MMDPKILLTKGEVFEICSIPECTIRGEFKDERSLFLHCSGISRWSPSVYKKCLEMLVSVLNAARDKGLERVYTFVEGNPKLLKFQLMFGFTPVTTYIDKDNNTHVLFEQVIP